MVFNLKEFRNQGTSTAEDIEYAKSFKAVDDTRWKLMNYTADLDESIRGIKQFLSEREYVESNSDNGQIEKSLSSVLNNL